MKTLNEVKESMQMLVDGGCDGICENCRYNGPVCLLTTVGHALEHICTLERIRVEQASAITSLRDAVSKRQLVQSRMQEEISRLETQIPRWIPVEERLPDKMKHVLVFKRRNDHSIYPVAMWHIETDWCGEDGWSKNPYNGYFDITHWMPLPEPPTKEDKK